MKYKGIVITFCVGLFTLLAASTALAKTTSKIKQVVIPEEDRFQPFVIQVRPGTTVKWTNQDTDDHTIVTDNTVTTTGPKGLNATIPGTTNNHGSPGTYSIRFKKQGVYVYYCRFHSKLDSANQPVAPGPDGGIQDISGNYGTPMMGIVVVAGSGS